MSKCILWLKNKTKQKLLNDTGTLQLFLFEIADSNGEREGEKVKRRSRGNNSEIGREIQTMKERRKEVGKERKKEKHMAHKFAVKELGKYHFYIQ